MRHPRDKRGLLRSTERGLRAPPRTLASVATMSLNRVRSISNLICEVSSVLRSPQLRIALIVVLLVIGAVLVNRPASDIRELERAIAADQVQAAVDGATEQKVVAFCSACHVLPLAGSFAKDAWHGEVMQGFHFYAKSGRNDLVPPTPQQAITYFRSKAPDHIQLPEQSDSPNATSITFRAQRFPYDKSSKVPPAVAHLKWMKLSQQNSGVLVACDMRLGTVLGLDVHSNRTVRSATARVGHPCHAEPCDLNDDGHPDLVVADLGSFDPDDHDRGRVLWLRGGDSNKWAVEVLAEKLGRVADVRPVDIDNDGDQDVVVAEFGWHSTGGILLLHNVADHGAPPKFLVERMSSRPGTIHVPCHDFDGEGLPDIVALVSQEFERVELMLNRPGQPWEVRTLWAASDPAFGMSGLDLVDLDQDGDVDVVFTNGDTFDSMSLKPSHGIQWLRNDGSLRFEYQRIADLSGAYRAIAADFDRDGDLDLIATAWMPRQTLFANETGFPRASLVLFEQTKPLQFERHVLQGGLPSFATLEVGDMNADGAPDLAVSSHLATLGQSNEGLVVWWNESVSMRRSRSHE